MNEPSQSFIVTVPREFDLAQRRRVGEEVVRFIRNRTAKGLDVNHRPFKAYSKEYVASKDFQNAKSSLVPNLRLTGEMTNLLGVLATGIGWIKIGFDDASENNKASWNRLNGRNFMGIASNDLQAIIDRHATITDGELIALEVSRAVGEELTRALFGVDDGDS